MDEVNSEELLKFTASADLGIQLLKNINLNHYTTISNKIFEYLMAGVPILASDFPEIRKIVADNNIGMVVDPEDRSAIKDSLQNIVQNPKLLEQFKMNMKKLQGLYTWDAEEKKLMILFIDVNFR